MSVKLQKERIQLCEVMCSPYCQTTVEGDVIVPDIKPDIQKILQVDNNVVINQKNVQSDKIYVQGTVRLNILYLPDNGEEWSVKAISTSQEFNHSMDIKGAIPGMELFVDAEIEPAEFTMVNSRKLNIRSKVGLSARLSGMKEMEVASGIDGEESIEVQGKMIQIYNPRVDACREIIIRERLEVPAGSPAICEILKVSARPCSTELRLLDGRAALRGELKLCTLYCGIGETRHPESMEHSVNFQESLEIDGICESMSGEVEYCVRDISYEVCQDGDGDDRILNCEIILSAMIRAFETVECRAMEDAYGKSHPVKLEKATYKIERMLGSETAQITANESVNIPDYLPQIRKLCEYNAVPTVENVVISGSTVTVSGYMTVNFLYLSDDAGQPFSGFSHILPFSHCFEVPGITEDAVCDARAEMEHMSCTISGERCLQVRAIVSISIKAIAPCSLELVSGIEYREDACPMKRPSMVVYFVQSGDTLWNIAKKYRTSMDAIIAANGDEGEIMKPGKCIYIFR